MTGYPVFKKGWGRYWLQLRWYVVRALAPRRAVQSRGVRLTLQCDNVLTHYRWETYNVKETETLDWIDRWVHDGDTVFDIGANIGVYTIYAALRHPQARVVAFEPEYANLHLLKENLVENGLLGRTQVYGIALSNHSGVSYLHLRDLTPGSSMHAESVDRFATTPPRSPAVWREGIYATTLDRFCEETGLRPHGLKIDVDGAELAVLEGASRTLRSEGLRSVIIEMDPGVRESCAARLTDAGLQRAWWDPHRRSINEVWVRRSSTNGA